MISKERLKEIFYKEYKIFYEYNREEDIFISNMTYQQYSQEINDKLMICSNFMNDACKNAKACNVVDVIKYLKTYDQDPVIQWYFDFLYEQYLQYCEYHYLIQITITNEKQLKDIYEWSANNKLIDHKIFKVYWFIDKNILHLGFFNDAILFKTKDELAFFRLANPTLEYKMISWN